MNIRQVTGRGFVATAIGFAGASSTLSATFDWPDILREPAPVVLASFQAGGTSLIWTWFAVAWTYGLVGIPILLLAAALGRGSDPVLKAAGAVGAASAVLSLIGFLRWVFVVPALAAQWTAGDATVKAAVEAAWTAQHQFGGALLGEHLGQLLAIAWSATISVIALTTKTATEKATAAKSPAEGAGRAATAEVAAGGAALLPRWIGWSGLVASGLYLLNQGDVLATAVPGFPVWDLAGLLGSTAWGLWVLALGVALVRRTK